jgi:acyl dehydratase
MTATALSPYRVEAFNTAKASENKIHDDAVARRFGFSGGLVPGVDVYAYMAHQPVAHWGRAWLERGTAECRFQKPVYDGDVATVTAAETADGLDIRVESRGETCAVGRASLRAQSAELPEPFASRRCLRLTGRRRAKRHLPSAHCSPSAHCRSPVSSSSSV